MKRVQCLTAFLLCSFSMSAMELITTNNSSGIQIIMDDFLTTMNCLRLNRQVRDTLRCTSKKGLQLVLSQDDLNKNYKDARDKEDTPQMAYWNNLGGCFYYQEFASAIKNKHYSLATWLFEQKKFIVWNAYCSNIKQAVETSTVDEMVPVIKWLLDTRRPVLHHGEFLSGYHFSNNLVNTYPEAKKIVDIFVQYKKDEIERKAQETVHQRMIAAACSGLSIAACYGPTTGYYHR